MTPFEVHLYFLENGQEVYEAVTFGDRWAAECYLEAIRGETVRGERVVHVTRAVLVAMPSAEAA